eukprot:7389132-Prymnesium_polylepis.1
MPVGISKARPRDDLLEDPAPPALPLCGPPWASALQNLNPSDTSVASATTTTRGGFVGVGLEASRNRGSIPKFSNKFPRTPSGVIVRLCSNQDGGPGLRPRGDRSIP